MLPSIPRSVPSVDLRGRQRAAAGLLRQCHAHTCHGARGLPSDRPADKRIPTELGQSPGLASVSLSVNIRQAVGSHTFPGWKAEGVGGALRIWGGTKKCRLRNEPQTPERCWLSRAGRVPGFSRGDSSDQAVHRATSWSSGSLLRVRSGRLGLTRLGRMGEVLHGGGKGSASLRTDSGADPAPAPLQRCRSCPAWCCRWR